MAQPFDLIGLKTVYPYAYTNRYGTVMYKVPNGYLSQGEIEKLEINVLDELKGKVHLEKNSDPDEDCFIPEEEINNGKEESKETSSTKNANGKQTKKEKID